MALPTYRRTPDEGPLVIDRQVALEILDEIERIFILHTRNITVHFDEYGIQVTVFPQVGRPFVLPEGPFDIRLHNGERRYLGG